jgi:hypothetical protein
MKRFRTIRVIILILSLGLAFGTPKTTLTEPQAAGTHPLPVIIFVKAPTVAAGRLAERFPKGSHLARLTSGTSSDSALNLTPDFLAAADPRVSFDASRILFAGRKDRRAKWQIWEMNADGSKKHQLTNCAADCFQPAYLPRNQIVFTMVAGKAPQQTSAIYVAQENGAGAHPITFGPGDFQVETVLRSGRILVSAKSSLVVGPRGGESRMFYLLRPDGSGLSPFRWDRAPNVVRSGAEELDDGTVLFVKKHGQAGGELAWMRPGALHNSVITPKGPVYWSAHALDGNRLVVAKADSGSSGAAGKFGLYVFNLATRSVEKTLFRSPKFSGVEAVPLEKRPVPLYYWSILHPDRDHGRVVCLNSYLSADAPHGRLEGHIARVRVVALQPDHRTERTLGDAPVENDGSFYIKVPANQPIRFELLGAKGEVIHEQKGWIWARTGEDVPCLGCHESKALVPGDHWPQALKRLDVPIPVGVSSNSHLPRH